MSTSSSAVAAPPAERRRVLRGDRAAAVGDHTFEVVDALPSVALTRPAPTGDHHVDALRAAAWEEGVALGRAEGHEAGRLEGYQAGRVEGRAAGYADGLGAARAAAEQELADRLGRVLAALETAAADLARRDAVTLGEIESAVVDLAVGLASAVVDAEVSCAADPGGDALRRALRLAPDRGALVARLHPDDLSAIGDLASLAPGRALEMVADPSVGRGGCIVENESTRVDARIDAALERARAVLLGEGPTDEDPSAS